MIKQDFKRFARWNSILTRNETVEIGQSPRELVYERDLLRVYRYQRETEATQATPILLIYSLVNRPAVLDLLPGRSVVQQLLDEGFEVYLLDWGVPSALDYYSGLDTYVNLYLRTVVRQVCKLAKVKKLNLLGYCMGGTLAAIYTAFHPKRVASLTLLGTPLRFRSDKQLYRWSSDPNLTRPESLVQAWRVAPAWSFEGYSLLTLDRKPQVLKHLYDNLDDEVFVTSYKAMERWVTDNIPMAASVYAEFIRTCFLEDRLLNGELNIAGRTVDLESIECPVLIISGTSDHLVPPETTCCREELFQHQTNIEFPSGHIGLSVSRSSHKKLWPTVRQWLCNPVATLNK